MKVSRVESDAPYELPPMMATVIFLLALLPQGAHADSMATGLEWMPIASVIVPAVLLAVLVYLGGRSTVRR